MKTNQHIDASTYVHVHTRTNACFEFRTFNVHMHSSPNIPLENLGTRRVNRGISDSRCRSHARDKKKNAIVYIYCNARDERIFKIRLEQCSLDSREPMARR